MITKIKYLLFFILLLSINHLAAQKSNIDSLLNLLKSDKQDTNKVIHTYKLADEYRRKGDLEAGIQLCTRAIQLADSINYKEGAAFARLNLGVIYTDNANYPKAEEILKQTLASFIKLENYKGITSSYNNIANVYIRQSNYVLALENHFAALKVREKIGDKKGLASSYNNISIIYKMQKNFDKALEYSLLSLKISEEADFKRGIADACNSIGNIYLKKNNFAKAIEYSVRSLKLREDMNDKKGISLSYNSIGVIYEEQGNYSKALENYIMSAKLKEQLNDKPGMAVSYKNIGVTYLKLKNIAQAKNNILYSLDIAKKIGAKDLLAHSYEAVADVYNSAGDYRLAYENYKLYKLYNDSIFNRESAKKTAQLSAQYESEKKDNEIKLLNKDKEKQAALADTEQKRQKMIIWSVGLGSLLALMFSLFILNRSRHTQKQKIIIEEQKRTVDEKQKEVLDSIHYAKRIQTSLLPTEKYVAKHLNSLNK